MTNIRLILLLLIYQFGTSFTFQMVGVFTLAWIATIAYTALYLYGSNLFKIKEFRQISWLYLALIAFQALAEFMAGNSFVNGAKGIAVDIVGYCNLFFLVSIFKRDTKLIVWFALFAFLRKLIFGVEGFENDDSLEESFDGEHASYFKFVVAPAIVSIYQLLTFFVSHRVMIPLYIYSSVIFVIAGARSGGLSVFITGFLVWFIEGRKGRATKQLAQYALVLTVVFYGAYAFYVSKVMDGTLTSGNNQQLAKSDNPYNPLEIIRYSRTDAWMGYVAWLDKPLWGHGSWALDTEYKYYKLMAEYKGEVFDINKDLRHGNLVPGHSVIFGKAAQNGVFVLVVICMLVWKFFRLGWVTFDFCERRYLFFLVNSLWGLVWTALFSPVGHIRDTLPGIFATIFVLWLNERKLSINTISNEKNLLCNDGRY